MLDIKNLNIKIEENEVTKKIYDFLKLTWLGIPRWLRNILIVTVVAGGFYFLYNRISISYEIDTIDTEITKLNDKLNSTVLYDRYGYDIKNVLTTVKTLERQIDESYRAREALILEFEDYAKRNSPNDQKIIRHLEEIREQVKHSHQSYKNIIIHQVDIYENDDILNFKQDNDEEKTSEKN